MLRSVVSLTMVFALAAQAASSDPGKSNSKARQRAARALLAAEAQQDKLVQKILDAVSCKVPPAPGGEAAPAMEAALLAKEAALLAKEAALLAREAAPKEEVPLPVVAPAMEVPPASVVIPPRYVAIPAEEVTRVVAARSGRPPAAAWVLGSVAVVAGGAGALTTYWGRKDNDAMAACAPWCATETVNHVKTMYIAADVAFGVGAASLLASTFLFARTPFAVAVQPTTAGASAAVIGRF